MKETFKSQFVIYVVSFANLILAVVLWATLRVAPADVLNELQRFRDETRIAHTTFNARFEGLNNEMSKRKESMDSIDDELAARTRDRFFRSQFEKWLTDAKRLNPEIELPEVDNDR